MCIVYARRYFYILQKLYIVSTFFSLVIASFFFFPFFLLLGNVKWSYCQERTNTGSYFSIDWTSDGTQFAGAGGSGEISFATMIERHHSSLFLSLSSLFLTFHISLNCTIHCSVYFFSPICVFRVGRSLEWKNLEIVLVANNLMRVYDNLQDHAEELDFRDRVIYK